MVDLESLSNSRRSCWLDCRYKYRMRYVDRYEPMGERDNSALVFGSYIHRILELGIQARSLTELKTIARDEIANYPIDKKYHNKVLPCLKNFLKFNQQLNYAGEAEKEYKLKIKDNYTQHGIIDRVIKYPGQLLIIDYKTSKREKTVFELSEDTQGMDYTYACSQMYKVDIDKIKFGHYYPITNNFVSVTYKKQAILENIKSTLKDVQNIRESSPEQMTPSENQFCNWCDYQAACPVFNPQHICEENMRNAKRRD